MVTVGEASENDNHITEVKLKLLSPKTKGHIEQTVNTTAVSGTNRKKMITKLEAQHFPVSAEVIMEVNVKDKYDEIWTRRYKVKTHVPLSKILSWWPVWFHTQQWGQPKWLPGQGDRVCGLRLYNHGTLFPHDLHAREEIDVWLAKKKYEGYLDEPNQGNKVPAEDWGETINLRDKWDQSSTIAGFSICWDDHWQWMYFSSHAKVFRRDLSFKSESFINNEISMAEIVIKFEKDSKNLRLRMNTRDGEVYRNTVADKGYDH